MWALHIISERSISQSVYTTYLQDELRYLFYKRAQELTNSFIVLYYKL